LAALLFLRFVKIFSSDKNKMSDDVIILLFITAAAFLLSHLFRNRETSPILVKEPVKITDSSEKIEVIKDLDANLHPIVPPGAESVVDWFTYSDIIFVSRAATFGALLTLLQSKSRQQHLVFFFEPYAQYASYVGRAISNSGLISPRSAPVPVSFGWSIRLNYNFVLWVVLISGLILIYGPTVRDNFSKFMSFLGHYDQLPSGGFNFHIYEKRVVIREYIVEKYNSLIVYIRENPYASGIALVAVVFVRTTLIGTAIGVLVTKALNNLFRR